MVDDTDNTSGKEFVRNIPVRSEEIGFSPADMIACSGCGKPNAPNRFACLYCGTPIAGTGGERLNARELESWEKGFNVIAGGFAEADIRTAAPKLGALMAVDQAQIDAILLSKGRVPVARVEFAEQASAISNLLSEHGLDNRTIRDEDLILSGPPLRLRAVEFNDDHLILKPFGGGDPSLLRRVDLSVIVSCTLIKERRESIERKKRTSTTTVSESQVSADQPIIDLYSRKEPFGWRIPVSGFDFSSLGADKSLLAPENMSRLLSRLCSFSPGVRLVDDYVSVRSLLEHCWPTEHRKETNASQRQGLMRNSTSVLSSDNLLQVTKYSRLQWHLL